MTATEQELRAAVRDLAAALKARSPYANALQRHAATIAACQEEGK